MSKSGDGLSISYVVSDGGEHRLMLADLAEFPGLLPATEIICGTNWFVNWADFPSVVPYQNGQGRAHFAHWLQYSGAGTYDYDIMHLDEILGGVPTRLHRDTVAAEHGFVSSARLPRGGLQVSWLDGRHTKTGVDGPQGARSDAARAGGPPDQAHGHGGAMTLRTKALTDSVSLELDHRVCDCCNTATVATEEMIMVAYRDRSEHEIRDIAYVTKMTGDGSWSVPKFVHADNWEIRGCPVNGPALASNDSGEIAIAWHSGAQNQPRIQFARFDREAGRFSPPVELDKEQPLGRVDIQLDDNGNAYVSALTTGKERDEVYLSLWTITGEGQLMRRELAATSGARAAGFPKIAVAQGFFHWARTVVGKGPGEQYVEICRRSLAIE